MDVFWISLPVSYAQLSTAGGKRTAYLDSISGALVVKQKGDAEMSEKSWALLVFCAIFIGIYTWAAVTDCTWGIAMNPGHARGFDWGMVSTIIVLTVSLICHEVVKAIRRT